MNVPLKPGPFAPVPRQGDVPRAESCHANSSHADPSHDARDLTAQGSRAVIVLDNQTYYLRITRAGKLILTK